MNGQLSPNADTWQFPAALDRVVDGDTVDMTVDLGFRCSREIRLRLFGIDTAEIYGATEGSEEFNRGQMHKAFVTGWFRVHTTADDWPFQAYTLKQTGKYGRYLADIVTQDGDSLVAAIHEEFGDDVLS